MSPPPCLYDTVIQSYVQLKSGFQVNGATLGRSCPPGVQVLPHCVVCSYRARQPLQMWQISHFYEIHSSELWVCEFWLLRWSTWLLRGVASVCWGDSWIGLLAAPSQTSPPSCFYDTSILEYPFVSFNGSLWDVLLRCSKWLLGAWLDSFTMILRCWLVVWVKWARPLVSMTLWSRVMFNWKAVQLKGRPISWAVLHHWKSMGQILVPSLPPRGATFTPFWGMVLQSLPASSNVANFTFLWNPLSELRGVNFFSQC